MAEHASAPLFDKDPAILVRQEAPFNAGPPLPLLREDFVTPTARFFVRSHGDVPAVDPAEYRLTVDGLVEHPLT
nr:sulfite oxidase [Herpetosiphonaceae bacterium]